MPREPDGWEWMRAELDDHFEAMMAQHMAFPPRDLGACLQTWIGTCQASGIPFADDDVTKGRISRVFGIMLASRTDWPQVAIFLRIYRELTPPPAPDREALARRARLPEPPPPRREPSAAEQAREREEEAAARSEQQRIGKARAAEVLDELRRRARISPALARGMGALHALAAGRDPTPVPSPQTGRGEDARAPALARPEFRSGVERSHPEHEEA